MKKLLILGLLFFSFWISQTNAFDISTSTDDVYQIDLTGSNWYNKIQFWDNWNYLYFLVNSTDTLYRYALSTPYDIKSSVATTSFNVSWWDTSPTAFVLSDLWDKLYVAGTTSKRISEFNLWISFDITTAILGSNVYMWAYHQYPWGLFINSDWTKIFSVDFNASNTAKAILVYNMSTWFDISTASFWGEFNTPIWYLHGLNFTPDWLWLFLLGYEHETLSYSVLSSPYDLSSIPLSSQFTVTANVTRWLDFNDDYTKFWTSDYYGIVRTYSTNDSIIFWPSPLQVVSTWSLHSEIYWLDLNQFETNEDFDLTYWIDDITNSNILVDSDTLWTQSWWIIDLEFHTYNYEYGVDYELNLALEDINFATWTTTINYPFTYLPTDWVLSTWSVNSIIAIENWLEIEFTCDTLCSIDYNVYFNLDGAWSSQDDANWTFVSQWPWTFTWHILNDSFYGLEFTNYADYLLDFTIKDVNFPLDVNFFFQYSVIDYLYNIIPQVFTEDDFIYSSNWLREFPWWFALYNFDVWPTWWTLWFNIIWPNQAWTWTINISAWPYFDESYWAINQYWTNVITYVNYPYHEFEWYYQVNMEYLFQWNTYYPYWTWYVDYYVWEPELSYTPIDIWLKCNSWTNTETWIIPWLSQFFYCTVEIVSTWIWNIDRAYEKIKEFFTALWNIWNTTESKQLFEAFNFDFEFIPSANAETYVYTWSQDPLKIISWWSFENIPLLNNIYNLVKYFILFGIFVYLMFLIFKPKNTNG